MTKSAPPWPRRPLIACVSLLAIGIVAGNIVHLPTRLVQTLIVGNLLVVTVAWLRRQSWIHMGSLAALVVLIGGGLYQVALNDSFSRTDIRHQLGTSGSPQVYEGFVAERPHVGLDRAQIAIDLTHCRDGASMRPTTGRVLLSADALPDGLTTGARVRFLATLHPLRAYRNPGGDARYWRRRAEGIVVVGHLTEAAWMTVLPGSVFRVRGVIDRWTARVEQSLRMLGSSDVTGVLLATITGNGGALSQEAWDRFRRVGAIHLLVISGFQVGSVLLCCWGLIHWALRRSPRLLMMLPAWKIAAGVSLIAVWGYASFVGGTVPVIRATLMATSFIGAMLVDRQRDVASALALAALVILCWSPLDLLLPSFQLTFAAVIGIVIWWPWLRRLLLSKVTEERSWMTRGWHVMVDGLLVTIAAMVGVLPFLFYHFYDTSLMGIGSNIVVGPIVGFLLTPTGFLYALVTPWSATIAGWIEVPLVAIATMVLQLIAWADRASGPWQVGFMPRSWEIPLWYAAWLLPIVWSRRRWRIGVGTVACACAAWTMSARVLDVLIPHPLTITFLDVGQGNATVIQFPNRQVMVVDGGGIAGSPFDIGRWVVTPALHHMDIGSIDSLLLTHHHPDHYGGLAFLAEGFSPHIFWTNGATADADDPLWPLIDARIAATGMPRQVLHEGEAPMTIGGVTVRVLSPGPAGPIPMLGQNNNSIVQEFTYSDVRILLTGDIEAAAEEALVQRGSLRPVTVLQSPHHGSNTSSTWSFLTAVRPSIVVISCGQQNRFRFPRPEVLARYGRLGARVYRTDQQGAVTIWTDGKTVNVETYVRQ